MSAVIHEVSHGVVAEHLGDPTARLAGRLTLNPIKHLDFFGSFLLPVSLYFLTGGSMVFGWAKPVPYNPNNLRDPLSGAGKIAVAGPASNLLIAIFFGIASRFLPVSEMLRNNMAIAVLSGRTDLVLTLLTSPVAMILYAFFVITLINILLAVFNLVPIPPLDGSKVLFAVLPKTEASYRAAYFLERYGMILVLIFVFFGFQLIAPIIQFLFTLITGQSFGF